MRRIDIATGHPAGLSAPAIAPTMRPVQVNQTEGHFGVYSESFAVLTEDQTPKFYDVTDLVLTVVKRAGIAAGTLTASTRHTTCALVVQEDDPLLLQDLAESLRRYVGAPEPSCVARANGQAHRQQLLLGVAVTLPIQEGRLVLGLWQRILLVELDRARPRQFSVQAMGVYARPPRLPFWE